MLHIQIKASDFSGKVGELTRRFEDGSAVHAVIAEVLYDQTVERFQREVAPSGKAWPKLSPLTLAGRRSSQGILRDKGELFRSVHAKSDASSARVGTNLDHPKVLTHQHGATIRPKTSAALVIPGGRGKGKPAFARQVSIPARPYIGFGRDDETLISEALLGHFSED